MPAQGWGQGDGHGQRKDDVRKLRGLTPRLKGGPYPLDGLTDDEFGDVLGPSWTAMSQDQRRRYPDLTQAEWAALEAAPSPERPLWWIPDDAFGAEV